jgi:hypothetical protein
VNRLQKLVVAVAAANLLVQLVLPPFDYIALQRGLLPTFDGFYFFLGEHANRVVNFGYLLMEVVVVLINAWIAWLLLSDDVRPRRRQGERHQRGVLALIAINLLLVLLFPPFENTYTVTTLALPTFDGFYFIFGGNSHRHIVTTVLYIELAAVLVNGALLWLFVGEQRD